MIRWHYILLCILSSMIAFIYFSYNQQWVIICLPAKKQVNTRENNQGIIKKTIKKIFWKHDHWNSEEDELLWSSDTAENVKQLISSWLIVLDEEKVMEKKVSIQAVVLSACGQEIFISFDRNPFDKKQSTYEKLLWTEGLFKTIRDNGVKIQWIQLLVHHKPLVDYHLDFSNPWPIHGFLSNN